MKRLLLALVVLCASTAQAWDYVPIERSRSYWGAAPYYGPIGGGPLMSRGYYPAYRSDIYYPVRVQVSRDPLDPLFPSRRFGGW